MEEPVQVEGNELRVTASDDDHTFMFEHKLALENTVTGMLFAEEFVEYKPDVAPEENVEENPDEEVKVKKTLRYYDEEDPELKEMLTAEDQEEKFNAIFIPQVICESKLKFFRVPKLGC